MSLDAVRHAVYLSATCRFAGGNPSQGGAIDWQRYALMSKGQLHSVQGSGLEWNEELRKAYAELEADPGSRRRRKRKLKEGRTPIISENQFVRRIRKEGWTTTKRGWPDFFLERDGEILLVEVKADKSVPLRDSQLRIARALKKYGVPVKRWSPDTGFAEIPDE